MRWLPGVASQSYSHWTQVAFEIGDESFARAQSPSSILTSTPWIPRSGAHATPATGARPAVTCEPERGTSIRDCVRTGARTAQPRGIQKPSNWSNRVSRSSVSHFVAET